MKVLTAFFLFYFPLFIGGCQTVEKGGETLGKPAGATTRVLESISKGANEQYRDKDQPNPYNR